MTSTNDDIHRGPGCCTTGANATTTEPSSCCTAPYSDAYRGEALDVLQEQEIPAEASALRSAGFRLLLDRGTAIEARDWAEAAGLDEPAIGRVLESAAGRVQLDHAGRLVGIAGLSVVPSPHEIDIGDRRRWTWCALDAVGILGALRATGTVRSTDPGTGSDIEIEFVDGRPQSDATLFILGGYEGSNIREDWCPLVNFFTDPDAARAWIGENGLEGDVVMVAQIAEDAAQMWQPLLEARDSST